MLLTSEQHTRIAAASKLSNPLECELTKLERADAEAEQVAVQKVLHVFNRAEALSDNPHMDTGDAIAFLTELP